jgi:hypothetical protein
MQLSALGAVTFCVLPQSGMTNLAFVFDKNGNVVRSAAFADPERVPGYLFWQEFVQIGDKKCDIDGGTVYSRDAVYPADIPRCVVVNLPD